MSSGCWEAYPQVAGSPVDMMREHVVCDASLVCVGFILSDIVPMLRLCSVLYLPGSGGLSQVHCPTCGEVSHGRLCCRSLAAVRLAIVSIVSMAHHWKAIVLSKEDIV